jgi:hypothetical protein
MTEQFLPPDTTECAMCGSTSRYQGIGSICGHEGSWIFKCGNCGLVMNLYPWPQVENPTTSQSRQRKKHTH